MGLTCSYAIPANRISFSYPYYCLKKNSLKILARAEQCSMWVNASPMKLLSLDEGMDVHALSYFVNCNFIE